jgi:TolB-like protein/tetratricopeptide (TPR) repeat protein/DNA-binding winged helix-turn-helix (wHTH) protein
MVGTNRAAGFRLGEWLVRPATGQIEGPDGIRELSPGELELLLLLAEHRGEAMDWRALKSRLWPDRTADDDELRRAVDGLRKVLGDDARAPRYLVELPGRGYALMGRYEALDSKVEGTPQAPPLPAGGSQAGRLESLLAELKHRSVLRVAGSYLVGMWIVLQVAEVTFEPLRLPQWWMTALTILAVLGLPIVAVLAWSYEITPGGIVRDGSGAGGLRLPRARRAIAPVLVVGAVLMAGVTGLAWWNTIEDRRSAEDGGRPAGASEASPNSIAVLPLDDLSPAGEAGYLGDGLSEELSSDLAKIPGLRVAARRSAFAIGSKGLDVRTIGAELGVRYVLEGSVRREGERVRVTAQLIDAVTGFHVWTESYDRPWQDLIGIQQQISGAIAEQLRIVLTPEESLRLKRVPTMDPRAYDFYLAGRAELRRGGAMSSLEAAAGLFRRALDTDPAFARAHAGLCEVYVTRYSRTQASEDVQAAETACRAALEADPGLEETEQALGTLYIMSGRYEQAEGLYRSLLTRAPRNADYHIGLGRSLEGQNRLEEAEAALREATLVEPGYWMAYNSLGSFLFAFGRSEEAVENYRRVTSLAPGNSSGFNNLGAALMTSGNLEAAAGAFERSVEIEPGRSAYSNLGTLYYFLGRMDEAVAMYSKAIEFAPQGFELWGSRADALWNIPQQRPRAIEDYRRATALAEQALAVNDTDADTWALLGWFYSRLGETERSQRYVQRSIELGPERPYVSYFAALTAAQQGDREQAARHMRRAMELGYPRVLAVSDPALKGVPIG